MSADRVQPGPSRARWLILLLPALLLMSPAATAVELRVAVAADFLASLRQLASRFETAENVQVVPVAGSTGKLYAQIANGAPFDIFLAADAERPRRLVDEGLGVAIKKAQAFNDVDQLWGAIFTLALLGSLMIGAVDVLGRTLLRWHAPAPTR